MHRGYASLESGSIHKCSNWTYIQRHQLALAVDRLLGALLTVKPSEPEIYFEAFHSALQDAFPDRYNVFSRSQQDGVLPTKLTNLDLFESSVCSSNSRDCTPEDTELSARSQVQGSSVEKVEGEDCVLFSAHTIPPEYQGIISSSAKFKLTYPAVCNGKEFSLQNEVHPRLRLANLFLKVIGRDLRAADWYVKSAKGHYEYENQRPDWEMGGLPNVKLNRDVMCPCLYAVRSPVVISAEALHTALDPKKMVEYLRFVGYENSEPLDVSHCREIYGEGCFELTPRELRALAQSTRIYTGVDLPPLFWLRLVGITSKDSLIQYYNDRKAIPLAWMATNSQVCKVGAWIKELCGSRQQRRKYGFKSDARFLRTIKQSLTELSTQVCIVQDGYFFSRADNQIAPKPPCPILFLSAPGIDFNSGAAARAEMSKYFVGSAFKSGGRAKFKARVKQTYNILFTACQDAGVTHPTAIAMGLGMFLPPIEREEVKRIYHEAQFELLSDKSYGFETYFLNPGPGKAAALQLLQENGYTFHCKVMLHFQDGKSIASQLASAGYRTSFLNPSDCIAVMQGCIGYWWETGLGERYAGEEDFCATSTAILARGNICTIWSAYDNDRMDELSKIKQVTFEGEEEEEEVAEVTSVL